jgi:hypothetical protein
LQESKQPSAAVEEEELRQKTDDSKGATISAIDPTSPGGEIGQSEAAPPDDTGVSGDKEDADGDQPAAGPCGELIY